MSFEEKEVWGGVQLEELEVKEQTFEQQIYEQMMSGTDFLKFSTRIRVKDGIEIWEKNVVIKNIGLTSSTTDFFINTRKANLFVHFGLEAKRIVGLRTETNAMVFVLNKSSKTMISCVKERESKSRDWITIEGKEVPVSDALKIVGACCD